LYPACLLNQVPLSAGYFSSPAPRFGSCSVITGTDESFQVFFSTPEGRWKKKMAGSESGNRKKSTFDFLNVNK